MRSEVWRAQQGAAAALTLPRAPGLDGPALQAARVLGLLVLHVPLALLMRASVQFATAHALATIAVGLWIAARGRKPEQVAYVMAYIAGVEVLWRMVQIPLMWETGKYFITALAVIGAVRASGRAIPALPVLYFLLLLPSVSIPFMEQTLDTARRFVTLNSAMRLALPAFLLGLTFCHFRKEGDDDRLPLSAIPTANGSRAHTAARS